MIYKASEIFFRMECETSQFSVFQDVSRNCCTTQNIELIVGHIPRSDDAQTSFSSVQPLLLTHLHQNIDNAGFDTGRILPDQSCHRYPSTSEEMQFVPWFRMWLFVTRYDFEVLTNAVL